MPTYEYRCPQCGEVIEIMHSMNDESERTCEACNSALERLISRSSFALKGGGWYKDLYSSTKPSDESSKPSDESSSKTSESSSKSSESSSKSSESSSKSSSDTSKSSGSDSKSSSSSSGSDSSSS